MTKPLFHKTIGRFLQLFFLPLFAATSFYYTIFEFLCPIRVVADDQPHGLTILPLPSLTYSSGEGLEYGGKIFAYQFGNASRKPYQWHVLMNFSKTTKQKTDYYTLIDIPHIFKPGSRLDMRMEFKNLPNQDFHGLGNQPVYRPELSHSENPLFISKQYYTYQQQWHAWMTNLQWPLTWKNWRMLSGVGIFYNKISANSASSLFSQQSPFGYKGGYSNFLRIGLIHDSRDFEAAPTSGAWSELIIEPALREFGNDYGYFRLTVIDRRYLKLHPRLVWAQRILAEAMLGSPPFYEMAVIGNSFQRHEGLGGAKTLRGQPRLLYVGPDKMVVNLELRWRFYDMTILKQQLCYYLHPFVDFGRVWMKNERFSLNQWHFSEGVGIHVQWKKEFVAVLEIGRSRYQNYAFYLSFGNLF
jgi:outer membrane protein assembly factor BamA